MAKFKDDEFDELMPMKKGSSRHKDLLKELEELDDYTNTSLAYDAPKKSSESNFMQNKVAEYNYHTEEDEKEVNQWMREIAYATGGKVKKGKKNLYDDIFNDDHKKKKKKNKGEKNDLIDYNKEFAPEVSLLNNLLRDQNTFTESLQRQYDAMVSTKSSSRGINKNITDLIENINGARSLSASLVKQHIDAKKLISELTIKQKKEAGINLDDSNISDYAASYLKQIIAARKDVMGGGDAAEVSDYNEDDLTAALTESLLTDDRSSEVDKYLMYENQNVTVYACVNPADADDYYYEAHNESGTVLDDYPLPLKTTLSINRSTNIATDTYGKKYNIIWK